jgi:GTP cyclohydrolase II
MASGSILQVKNVRGAVSSSFGDPQHIGVQRGIGEIRAGRPVLVQGVESGADRAVAVLPVDGIDADRLAAFRALVAPEGPRLAITAPRARVLGIDIDQPVTLALPASAGVDDILTIAAADKAEAGSSWTAADAVEGSALELMKLAQRFPAALVAPAPRGAGPDGYPLICVDAAAVSGFRTAVIASLTVAGEAQIPLQNGVQTRFVVFNDAIGAEAVAVVIKKPDLAEPVPVRMHSACLTGDVFGSRRCDCGDQLRLALEQIAGMGGGIILYLDQEGRGLGLANKVRAYRLQDTGLDTVDANTTLGFDDDEREYGVAARMLQMLGCTRIRLLTNNPAKIGALSEAGIEVVGRLPLMVPVSRENRRYLTAKAKRAGHRIEGVMEALAGKE